MRRHRTVSAETPRAAGLVAGRVAPAPVAAVLTALALPTLAAGQVPADTTDGRAEVLAVVEESLERISEEDGPAAAGLPPASGRAAGRLSRPGPAPWATRCPVGPDPVAAPRGPISLRR